MAGRRQIDTKLSIWSQSGVNLDSTKNKIMPTIVQITIGPAPNNPSVTVVDINGELDESNLPELESAVNPLVDDENNKILLLKLNGLEFMSSKIIGYLASVYNKLNGTGRQIALAGCNKTIDDILSIVGLNQMIVCYRTPEEAFAQLHNNQ
jgi:anti-anti-sigma factor